MTSQQILEKAIQKAIDGGFGSVEFDVLALSGELDKPENYYRLIFNHDFAKALWGNEKITRRRYVPDYYHLGEYILEPEASTKTTNAWKHHLQQMVIADNPIKYLGENI